MGKSIEVFTFTPVRTFFALSFENLNYSFRVSNYSNNYHTKKYNTRITLCKNEQHSEKMNFFI